MPAAMEVQPEKWSQIVVLFDDGEYSVISGMYEDDPRRKLGERWNGDADSPLGFPNVAEYPVWHVVLRFLEIPILHGLLDEFAKRPRGGQTGTNTSEYIMQELRNRHHAAESARRAAP